MSHALSSCALPSAALPCCQPHTHPAAVLSQVVPLSWKVGAIYHLYLLYLTQPDCVHVRIRVGPWEWARLRSLTATLTPLGEAGGAHDVRGILTLLHRANAFEFAITARRPNYSALTLAGELYEEGSIAASQVRSIAHTPFKYALHGLLPTVAQLMDPLPAPPCSPQTSCSVGEECTPGAGAPAEASRVCPRQTQGSESCASVLPSAARLQSTDAVAQPMLPLSGAEKGVLAAHLLIPGDTYDQARSRVLGHAALVCTGHNRGMPALLDALQPQLVLANEALAQAGMVPRGSKNVSCASPVLQPAAVDAALAASWVAPMPWLPHVFASAPSSPVEPSARTRGNYASFDGRRVGVPPAPELLSTFLDDDGEEDASSVPTHDGPPPDGSTSRQRRMHRGGGKNASSARRGRMQQASPSVPSVLARHGARAQAEVAAYRDVVAGAHYQRAPPTTTPTSATTISLLPCIDLDEEQVVWGGAHVAAHAEGLERDAALIHNARPLKRRRGEDERAESLDPVSARPAPEGGAHVSAESEPAELPDLRGLGMVSIGCGIPLRSHDVAALRATVASVLPEHITASSLDSGVAPCILPCHRPLLIPDQVHTLGRIAAHLFPDAACK
ncbi:hypothetical protein EON66_04175 [archaeon]|nr:MAG: hypothetical protein EON66_04175 [archaeon]